MKNLLYLLLTFLMISCASIPKDSVDLMEVVIVQNQKAYNLNVALVNKLYTEKNQDVDAFIDGKYTNEIWSQFKARIPAGVDIESNITSIIPSLSKQINAQRNVMKEVLETARLQTLKLIENDFAIQKQASSEVKNLLVSATKVNEDRRQILQNYANQFNLGLDINQVESSIDDFIVNAGDVGADIDELGQELLKKLDEFKNK